MSPEGPQDSPAVSDPTTVSAVEPLPPGSNAEEVVDDIDKRIKESWAELEKDDDTETRDSSGPDEPDSEVDEDGEPPSEPTG